MRRLLSVFLFLLLFTHPGKAQRYLTEYDSTLYLLDTLRTTVKRFENLFISGYIQPQFQVAQSKGAPSYEGGNFSEFSNNRFMLRRARVKLDYFFPAKTGSFPSALFSFQFDATERGVNVRDMYARVFEPRWHNFALTMGLFARPFGFEVNLSSAFRETPERGRMSQILMPTERDLGGMLTYEPQKLKNGKRKPIKVDVALVNGQGLAPGGVTDFDQYKDLISRITLKPVDVGGLQLSGGLSLLNGGWRQATRYKWTMSEDGGKSRFVLDSSIANMGAKAGRHYYGADVQVVKKHRWGKTELRAEYWRGTQPGTVNSTANPGVLPQGPTYIRPFDGGFMYLLQNLGSSKHELMFKYDWYDPNRKVRGRQIGFNGEQFTAADVLFGTFGFGYTRYFNNRVKFLVYYAHVVNEATGLPDYTRDLEDDVFTARFQLRF